MDTLVNFERAEPRFPGQFSASVNKYMGYLWRHGDGALHDGFSYRKFGARFGIDKNTVASMVKRIPDVQCFGTDDKAADPGTGQPRWKHVKGNAIRDAFPIPTADMKAERFAADFAKFLAKHEAAAIRAGFALWRADAIATASDPDDAFLRCVDQTIEIAAPMEPDEASDF